MTWGNGRHDARRCASILFVYSASGLFGHPPVLGAVHLDGCNPSKLPSSVYQCQCWESQGVSCMEGFCRWLVAQFGCFTQPPLHQQAASINPSQQHFFWCIGSMHYYNQQKMPHISPPDNRFTKIPDTQESERPADNTHIVTIICSTFCSLSKNNGRVVAGSLRHQRAYGARNSYRLAVDRCSSCCCCYWCQITAGTHFAASSWSYCLDQQLTVRGSAALQPVHLYHQRHWIPVCAVS